MHVVRPHMKISECRFCFSSPAPHHKNCKCGILGKVDVGLRMPIQAPGLVRVCARSGSEPLKTYISGNIRDFNFSYSDFLFLFFHEMYYDLFEQEICIIMMMSDGQRKLKL